MKVFATEKNIGEREVRRVIKVGSQINIAIQDKDGFDKNLSIKITKFTVGPGALFVQGTHGNGNYVLNILQKSWMCLSDTEMTNGKIIGPVYSGTNAVTFDGAAGEFYYTDIERNIREFVPVVAGDIIRKPGNSGIYEYEILAVAADGAIFIDRINTNNENYYQRSITSMLLRINDTSAISVFQGLKVITA